MQEYADVETASDGYARRFAGPTGAWLLAAQERLVRRAVDRLTTSSSPLAIPDVGGGHGQLAVPLTEAGHRVTVLASGPQRQPPLDALIAANRCSFVVGDLHAFPFPDASFDVVTSVRLLSHMDEWPVLIRELCRVARHSVIIDYPTEPLFSRLSPWLFRMKRKLEGNTRSYTLFTDKQIRATFARHDFSCADRAGQFFWPMVIHRVLGSPAMSAVLEAPPAVLGLTGRFGSPVIAELRRR